MTNYGTATYDPLCEESHDGTPRRIVSSAVEIVEGCDSAGILVRDRDKVETPASTDGLAAESDRLQERLVEGPCFDIAVAREREEGGAHVFRIEDLTELEQRWPRYSPAARELGVGSMMTFLLFADRGVRRAEPVRAPAGSLHREQRDRGTVAGLARRRRALRRPHVHAAARRSGGTED
ncbi:hypothetical protein [Streptomyces sp. MBT53]|uniref:hypothetical protein n=1 Tax=Streptomyces sp. MBT53 TaxID=1488384 RepID=UPI001912A4EB|nr:hypothetical protein [Streptomyces sp. MBT53]MBK6014067.1 hypothetical protein [Streptomyces sp. MBT53]